MSNFGVVAAALLQVTATDPPLETGSDESVSMPAADLQFYRNKDGLTFANAWGDPATGPHSNFIRIISQTSSPQHVHTASYYGTVISGTISNEQEGKPDLPLGPGSYWYQRGQEPHVTKCLSKSDCLIFVTSKGPFDFYPVEEDEGRTRPPPAPSR